VDGDEVGVWFFSLGFLDRRKMADWKMAHRPIEIVDLPSYKMVVFHSDWLVVWNMAGL
jgi:hypothetical protein